MIAMIRNGIAVAAVVLVGSAALAQSQSEQTRHQKKRADNAKQNWKQVIRQMEGDGITLEEAISKATDKVGGNAISARVMTNFTHPRDAQRYKSGKTSQYRIEVLCRTDNGKFKVVTLNGRNGKVLGTASASRTDSYQRYAQRGQMRSKSDWRMGNEDFAVFRLMKCSALEDTTVTNNADQDLGHVSDLAVDPSNGRVSYAALSFGGWLGMGDELFAVPLQALEVNSADEVVLDLTKQELENAQGFNQDNWPTHANQRWAADLKSTSDEDYELVAHEERQRKQRRDRSSKITSIEQASDLIGMTVKNKQGEELGSISDLYIDPDRARVAYAVLSHGGWLGMGDKLFAIPWESFEISQKDTLILNISKNRLKNAPGATEDDQDKWSDADWVQDVYNYFDADPYWQDELEEHTGRDL